MSTWVLYRLKDQMPDFLSMACIPCPFKKGTMTNPNYTEVEISEDTAIVLIHAIAIMGYTVPEVDFAAHRTGMRVPQIQTIAIEHKVDFQIGEKN